ncbi:hypothetical protein GW17_00016868, partial [Ensete ventricosum]
MGFSSFSVVFAFRPESKLRLRVALLIVYIANHRSNCFKIREQCRLRSALGRAASIGNGIGKIELTSYHGKRTQLTFLLLCLSNPFLFSQIIPKKNRHEICKYLFQEGVLYAKKDYNLAKHPDIDVPNLQVIKLMQSFKSREYVRETFAWQHYYWYLTNDGIEYLRTYLNLPSEIVPATLKKSSRPPPRPFGSGPPGDRP